MSAEHAERYRRKLYGRRKGPALSVRQEHLLETLLPKLTPELREGADPRSYFASPSPPLRGEVENSQAQRSEFSGGGTVLDEHPPPGSLRSPTSPQGGDDYNVDDVWLEIGFGAGEHLHWQAVNHPRVGLIGAEPFVNGVAKLLSKIEEEPTPNIRIYMDDARDIISALPDASVGRVFVLFPDPWPKVRHHKRRFLQTEMLDQLARVMKPGAELRFASDDAPLLEFTLEILMAHPAFRWTAQCAADWHIRPLDWPQTRYEAKQLHGIPAFLRFCRV
ncbi:MAG: tRNA (guanosine(46)-N7)-methyltransferase TrmB [Proteobacteria bacterium]|nr:tRNA (guanosine(46)-N7)-methyltransferase TrmB [Pseudomonadota bacterium]